jgi:hypothetical protein
LGQNLWLAKGWVMAVAVCWELTNLTCHISLRRPGAVHKSTSKR